MKLATKKLTTVTHGNIVSRDFTIGNAAKVIRLLSSTIYSNKILAPIRELVCNAHDSHVAAGTTDKRFIVHLPTVDEAYFSIRDYGVGLDDEEVCRLYTSYGSSTKDNSNTEIGCFGLGSKAPFAYTDRFEVNAFKDGMTNSYQCIFEGDNIKFHRLGGTVETGARNGLEVRFDVKRDDVAQFREEMKKMFMFQKEIEFAGYTGIIWRPFPDFTLDFAPTDRCSDWGVEMGGVVYDIGHSDFGFLPTLNSIRIHNRYDRGYLIHVGLGEVAMTVSRESIEWTPESIDAVERKAKALIAGIAKKVKEEMRKEKTLWDKIGAYKKYYDDYKFYRPKWYSIVRDAANGKDTLNGVRLVSAGKAKGEAGTKRLLSSVLSSLALFSKTSKIQFIDITEEGKIHSGIKNKSADNPGDDYICVSNEKVAKLLKRLGAKMTKASDYDKYKTKRTGTNTGVRDKNVQTRDKSDSWLSGVRMFSGVESAPYTLSKSDIDEKVKRDKIIYYTLQDRAHVRVVDQYDSAYTPGEHAYNAVTWSTVYSTLKVFVVTARGLKGLTETYGASKLVDVKTLVKNYVEDKDKFMPSVAEYDLNTCLDTSAYRWNKYLHILAIMAPLFQGKLREFLERNKKGASSAYVDAADKLAVTLFRCECRDDNKEKAIKLIEHMDKVVQKYFPLIPAVYAFSVHTLSLAVEKDLIYYVESKLEEVKQLIEKDNKNNKN